MDGELHLVLAENTLLYVCVIFITDFYSSQTRCPRFLNDNTVM